MMSEFAYLKFCLGSDTEVGARMRLAQNWKRFKKVLNKEIEKTIKKLNHGT